MDSRNRDIWETIQPPRGSSRPDSSNGKVGLDLSGYPLIKMNNPTLATGFRSYHVSSASLEEMKFLVDEGVYLTRSEVQGIDPTERTITQWRVLVDWDLVKQRPWVVVDPIDPTGLLYLSQKDYLAYAKVGASTDLPFMVICRPGVKRPVSLAAPNNSSPSDSSQNSPWGVKWEGRMRTSATFTWRTFCALRSRIHLLVNKSKPKDKMVSESYKTITRTVLVWARQLAHYAEVKNAGAIPSYLVPYTGYMRKLLQNNGQMALVLHLKVALFALYSYISGNPLTSTYALGAPMRLDRSGLPLAFGIRFRELIRSGSLSHIRLMASLLNIYRAMEAPHKPADITSIVQPLPDITKNETFSEFKRFCAEVLPGLLRKETGLPLTFNYESGLGLIVRTAGANVAGPAMGSVASDALAWANQPENHVLKWFDLHGDTHASKIMSLCSGDHHYGGSEMNFTDDEMPRQGLTMAAAYMATRSAFSSGPFEQGLPEGTPYYPGSQIPGPILGRLHAIDEPAGKVRVVAICDYWTQVSMKPVHDHLFNILRNISTDATFDQSGRVEGYFNAGHSPHWSFDLKTATDTIPITLYIEVMAVMLRCEGETSIEARQRAELWAKVMTDRDFLTPSKEGYARYRRGQPMGALSSWASMAIVHHAMVQFSHWKVTQLSGCDPSWFKTYLVLGDDVDIAVNSDVAQCYKDSSAELAIIIGLLKTLRSNKNCFEFANRRFSPDGDVSPLSLKEELASNSWIARLEYAKRILVRFGTSYSDPGLALLRKATTVRQWDVLIPELSGARGDTTYLNAVRFLLENPFAHKELHGVPVERVLSWLAYLLPEEDKIRLSKFSSDTHNIAMFSAVCASKLVTLLDMEVQKALDGIPSRNLLGKLEHSAPLKFREQPTTRSQILIARAEVSGVSYSSKEELVFNVETKKKDKVERYHLTTQLPKRISDLVEKLSGLNASQTVTWRGTKKEPGYTYTTGDGTPLDYDALVTLIYNQWCFAAHNERIQEKLEELKRSLVILKAYLRGPPSTVSEAFAADRYVSGDADFEANTYLGAAFQVWTDFTAIPKVIQPDFSVGSESWLPQSVEGPVPYIEILHRLPNGQRSIEKILTIMEERSRGPIRALGYALAKEFGIIIPSLHDMAFEKAPMKGNSWLTLVRQWRKDGKLSRLISGSALTLAERGEVLPRMIKKARNIWWSMVEVSNASGDITPMEGIMDMSSGSEDAKV